MYDGYVERLVILMKGGRIWEFGEEGWEGGGDYM